MTVAEIAEVTLKPGTDLKTHGSKDIELAKSLYKTIAEQEGCGGVWYGVQVENPEKLDLVIEWSHIDDHKKFIASSAYGPFKEQVSTILADGPNSLIIRHVNFSSPFEKILAAPVVEMLLMYTAQGSGDEVPEGIEKVARAVEAPEDGSLGAVHGWLVEELELEGAEGKFKGYLAAIAWPTVEAHLAFRGTQIFKDHAPILVGLAKTRVVHHTAFAKYE